jgi:hypothetical protein
MSQRSRQPATGSRTSRLPATEEEPKEEYPNPPTTSRFPGSPRLRRISGQVSRFDPTRSGTTQPAISTSQVPIFGSSSQSCLTPVTSTIPFQPPTAGIPPPPFKGITRLA